MSIENLYSEISCNIPIAFYSMLNYRLQYDKAEKRQIWLHRKLFSPR